MRSFNGSLALRFVFVMIFIALTRFLGLWDAPRYESTAKVAVSKSPSAAQGLDVSAIIGGTQTQKSDLLLIREYLNSLPYINEVDGELRLRQHYHEYHGLSSLFEVSRSVLYDWYREVTNIQLDDYSGVLVIKVQAYTPEMAKSIVEYHIRSAEAFINNIGRKRASKELEYSMELVTRYRGELDEAKFRLNAFQIDQQFQSVEKESARLDAQRSDIEKRLIDVRSERVKKSSFLNSQSAEIKALDAEIVLLLERKADIEKVMLGSDNSLLSVGPQYQALLMSVDRARGSYQSALIAYEQVSLSATRQLKYLMVVESPIKGEDPVYPEPLRVVISALVITLALMFSVFAVTRSIRESVH
ncbi:hypothetical protein ACP3V3_02840 [Vibrio sp. PNB22_3_1]